jgi:cytochrome c
MKTLWISALGLSLALSGAAYAQGDAAAGEKTFKKCKACHTISNGDEVIVKGGKTGPNLYGVVGRPAGSYEGFKYSKSMVAAGEGGLVWTEELIAQFVQDPKAYLKDLLGDSKAKSKMTFKLKKGGVDVAAYLASLAPAAE